MRRYPAIVDAVAGLAAAIVAVACPASANDRYRQGHRGQVHHGHGYSYYPAAVIHVAPAPVYYAPPPVVYAQPVVYPQPVVYAPAPVVAYPAPVYAPARPAITISFPALVFPLGGRR